MMDHQAQPDATGPFAPAQSPAPPPPVPPPGYGGYPQYPGYTYGYPYAPPPIVQPRLAGFWWRFLAAQIIDATVVGVPVRLLTLPLSVQLSRAAMLNPPRASADIFAVYRDSLPAWIGLTILGLLINVLYEGLLIGKWHGQTVGKRICNLRVVRDNGGEVPLGRAFARAAMKLVSGWALSLGYLWMLWDPKKQTWHDKVARTLVLKV